MKKLFFLSFIVINNSYGCELLNQDFMFYHAINDKEKVIYYSIEKKDKTKFKFFDNNSSSIGFKLLKQDNINYEFKSNAYDYFYNESFFHSNFIFTSLSPSLDYGKFSDNNIISDFKIKGEIKYTEFIEKIRRQSVRPLGFGKELIFFKFKYNLDKDMKHCIEFKTQNILYDFGGMFSIIKLLKTKKNEISY